MHISNNCSTFAVYKLINNFKFKIMKQLSVFSVPMKWANELFIVKVCASNANEANNRAKELNPSALIIGIAYKE